MTNFKEYFDTLSKRVKSIKQWLRYWLIGERFTDWGAGSSTGAYNWRDKFNAMKVAIHAKAMASAIHAQEIRLPQPAVLQQWLTPKLSKKSYDISDDQVDAILMLIDKLRQESGFPAGELTPEEQPPVENSDESELLWERTADQFNLPTQYMFGVDGAEKPSHTPSVGYARNFHQEIDDQRALEREFDAVPVHDSHTPIGKLTEFMVQHLEVDLDIRRDQSVIVSINQTFELNILNGVGEDVVKTIENCFMNKTSILGAWKIKHSRTMRVDGYARIESLRAGKGLVSNVLLIVEGFIQPINTPRNKRLADFISGEK
jgi:hypothetical protein